MTSKSGKMGLRYKPMAFTEQGVAMLSGVLKSDRAVQVNIQIMRTFTQLRKMLSTHAGLKKKIESIEKKYDDQVQIERLSRLPCIQERWCPAIVGYTKLLKYYL